MARLTDPAIVSRIRHALSQWHFTGYVTWKPVARAWVEENLEGWSTRAIAEEMFRFFEQGGEIDQTRETRPQWTQWPCHYDFRMEIGGRPLYIETVLVEDDADDPTLHVVSIHDA
jgi:hypothetical protein